MLLKVGPISRIPNFLWDIYLYVQINIFMVTISLSYMAKICKIHENMANFSQLFVSLISPWYQQFLLLFTIFPPDLSRMGPISKIPNFLWDMCKLTFSLRPKWAKYARFRKICPTHHNSSFY